MIQPDHIKDFKTQGQQTLDERDVILYALGVGATSAAEDRQYVYEESLTPLPAMASILAREPYWLSNPRTGIDVAKILHGEQSLEIHAPLFVKGNLRSELSVVGLYDRGSAKGAVLDMRRELFDAASGVHLATIGIRSMLRGNGGFGGSAAGIPVPHATPDGSPDVVVSLSTTREQALIYRLSGDFNPIHVDEDVARNAGFAGPILHGLCTYGIAARAIVRGVLKDEASRLRRFDVRFSSPVYPGETIVTEIWRQGGGQAAFRCLVAERGVVVIQNGLARFD